MEDEEEEEEEEEGEGERRANDNEEEEEDSFVLIDAISTSSTAVVVVVIVVLTSAVDGLDDDAAADVVLDVAIFSAKTAAMRAFSRAKTTPVIYASNPASCAIPCLLPSVTATSPDSAAGVAVDEDEEEDDDERASPLSPTVAYV